MALLPGDSGADLKKALAQRKSLGYLLWILDACSRSGFSAVVATDREFTTHQRASSIDRTRNFLPYLSTKSNALSTTGALLDVHPLGDLGLPHESPVRLVLLHEPGRNIVSRRQIHHPATTAGSAAQAIKGGVSQRKSPSRWLWRCRRAPSRCRCAGQSGSTPRAERRGGTWEKSCRAVLDRRRGWPRRGRADWPC